jgi:hypothetical protein
MVFFLFRGMHNGESREGLQIEAIVHAAELDW